ncbi:MAG: DUF4118 domain-containing protein [Capsulimonadaceae bacterium]|nr:DUF4118 domain-containing protein [Capsulimonadaceae bacterium]
MTFPPTFIWERFRKEGRWTLPPEEAAPYGWSLLGVAAATVCFWLLRHDFDKGQASLLYLPIVIACAVRLGFGPAICAAITSFVAWDFFYLPPYYTLIIENPKDWLSLGVFLLAAITTAKLASDARLQTEQAQLREAEISTLYQASQEASQEVDINLLIPRLAAQLEQLCQSPCCLVFAYNGQTQRMQLLSKESSHGEIERAAIAEVAEEVFKKSQEIGFGPKDFWSRAILESHLISEAEMPLVRGVYVPLRVQGRRMGVVYVAPHRDGRLFSDLEERLIRTLANHAAIALARQELSDQAAEARALREADTLKDRILSLASHEMRSPLASIKAAATGLLQSEDAYGEQDRRDALKSIAGEVDRMTNLVTNMLDLSRLEAGNWKPEKDWCDLQEIVGTALDRLGESDAARVHVVAASDLPMVLADYTQVALVITNLLTNAVKYSPEGSAIDVTLTRTVDEDLGQYVQVAVRDYGEGIQPGEETRIFDRFYRSPRHRKSAIHGTGLGLSLCYAIATAHGGRILASNAPPPGRSGAVFEFSLPVNAA